jgi:hypothetical protein
MYLEQRGALALHSTILKHPFKPCYRPFMDEKWRVCLGHSMVERGAVSQKPAIGGGLDVQMDEPT